MTWSEWIPAAVSAASAVVVWVGVFQLRRAVRMLARERRELAMDVLNLGLRKRDPHAGIKVIS